MSAENENGGLTTTLADIEAIASDKGLSVRLPGPRELFIDIDSESAEAQFYRLFAVFKQQEKATSSLAPSPSGASGRYHVVVTLERDIKDAAERVTLQALLGSDTMRELLAWRRIQVGAEEKTISVFFEKPEQSP